MDILMYSIEYFWLIVSIFFLLLEMGSPGLFFFLSFFCGAIVAAGASLWIPSVITQVGFFFVGTILSLIVLRYFIIPLVGKDRPSERTNVYALQGKRGFVTISIQEKQWGMVKVNGATWAARCLHGSIINVGDEIEVIDIRGTHLIVKKI